MAKLVSPSQPMDSSIDQDSLFDSSMDSGTLGLSVGGEGGAEGVAKGDTTAEVPDIELSGPEAQNEVAPSDAGAPLEQVKPVVDSGVAHSLQDSGVHSEPTASLRKILAGTCKILINLINNLRGNQCIPPSSGVLITA